MADMYADGFANIAVTGALVRIDLSSLKTPGGPDQTPQMEVSQRLVMPLDGFLRAYGLAEQVVQKMVADGLIKRASDQVTGAGTSETTAQG